MKRLQWDKNRGAELPPLEREILELKEENRRLEGLLELREDRTALEKFQVQSRNRILGVGLGMLAVLILAWFSSWLYLESQIASRDQELKLSKEAYSKLKNQRGATYFSPADQ